MSKKPKTGFTQDLWVVEYIDRMNRSDSFEGQAMPRAEAEAKYAALTDNGTRKTAQDKTSMGYYQLRQKA